MKKLIFIALLFVGFYSQAQTNRFPSIDSAKNYVLRYIRNSTVESFTNLRMQNVSYGTLELLDSLISAGGSSGVSGVDSIWVNSSATKDSIKYSISGTTYTAGVLDKASVVQSNLDTTRTGIRTDLNGKQGALTLTTIGSSGASTLVGNTLNIPQYSGGSGGSGDTSLWSIFGSNIYAKGNRYIALGDTNRVATVPLDLKSEPNLWGFTVQPNNYLTSYGIDYPTQYGRQNKWYGWGYGRFDGVNMIPPNRPNVVFIPYGYNATIGGGRVDTAEAGWQVRMETHYQISPIPASDPIFEFHMPEFYSKDGNSNRILSFHPKAQTGYTYTTSATDSWGWVIRNAAGPRYWATLAGGRSSDNSESLTASFSLDANTSSAGTNNIIYLGGQNGIDNGFGGNTFIIQNYPHASENFAQIGFPTPASRTLNIKSQTINVNTSSMNSRVNMYGNVAIPEDGKGLSIGAGVTALFDPNAKLHIYGDGTTTSTISVRVDKGNPFNASFRIYDDGSVLANMDGGQTSFGVSSIGSISASAKVQINSTTQGFLPPRMTATQASAISSPAEGLMVYVTDTNGTFTAKGWWGYDGAAWVKLN